MLPQIIKFLQQSTIKLLEFMIKEFYSSHSKSRSLDEVKKHQINKDPNYQMGYNKAKDVIQAQKEKLRTKRNSQTQKDLETIMRSQTFQDRRQQDDMPEDIL